MRKSDPDATVRNQDKSFWHAFLDWFVLFSGISTRSNLSRTRNAPITGRGLFLFRKPGKSPRIPR